MCLHNVLSGRIKWARQHHLPVDPHHFKVLRYPNPQAPTANCYSCSRRLTLRACYRRGLTRDSVSVMSDKLEPLFVHIQQ